MKKLNLLKLFILIATAITSLTISAQEYGSGAQKIDGVWYSTTLHTDGSQYAFVRDEWDWESENKFDLNIQYPSNKVKFNLKNQTGVSYGALDWSSKKCTFTIKWNEGSYTTPQGALSTDSKTFEAEITTNTSIINFIRNKANLSCYLTNVYVTMAHHIKMASDTTNNYGDVEIEDSKPFTVDFHSFLSKGTLTATTSNPDVFRINGTKEKTVQIAGANECEKVNQGNYNFTINFVPQATIDYTGIVTITDGTNSITINLSGKGTKKQPTITWATNKTIGESEQLTKVATSDCGTGVTLSSADENIIKIINGTILEGVTAGEVEITATTTGNDKWASISSTETFTVTTKTVQNIVWEQDFYLLKLGDEAITLNAYATDKKTGNANNNEIVYSSANENVVKIENGVLSIVGVGYTTITAHQQGDDTYAPTYLIKTVIVREVSDNCDGTYAFIGENKTVQQGTITYTFNKPGRNFSFNANITSNVRLTITDDLGNTLHQEDYNKKSASLSNITLDPKARMLMFNVYGLDTWFGAPQVNEKDVTISDLLIEQAQYITPSAESVAITPTEFGKSSSTTFNVSYSGQPDVIIATLQNGKYFELENSVINTTGRCDATVTESFSIKFTPDSAGTFTDILVITCKEYTKEIPITASGIGRNQLIEWNQDLSSLTLNSKPTKLIATSTEGLAVYYESSNENVATISGHTLTIVGAGEATITAKQDGDKAHLAATPVSKTITIAKLDQTITWNQEFAADLTIGNTIELSASASSGDAVTFSSSNEAVATIAGNVLTIVGVGEATITAFQAGNNNYNAATEIAKSLSIAKLNQTITWNQDLAGLMIGNTETLNATASSGLEITYSSDNDAVASINGSTITVNGDGTVTITATQAGNDTYNATSIKKTFTLGRTTQTITWNDDLSTLKINDVITLTATSDAGLEITYTIDNSAVATIEDNILTIVGAGEANITAQQAGNDTYNSASVIKTINIEHLTQTIDWKQDLSSLTLESETIELNAAATSGLDIVYSSSNIAVATIEGNTLTIVGAGETTITARQAGNHQYTPAEITQTLNISKLSQTIVWEQNLNDITLLENFFELTAEATSGLIVTYTSSNEAVAQINGNILSIIGEGEATITATQLGNEKYDAAAAIEKTITITKQSQEIIWDQDFSDLDLEDYPYELTAYATSGLPVIYELDNLSYGEKAIIEDNYLYPYLGNCSITIYAHQQGNEIYKAAQTIEKTVYINTTKLDPTNIDNNTTTTMIYTDNIVYFNGEHNTLRVFDMTGRMIYSANVEGENSHYLPLSQRGIYVICLDNQSLKIVK